MLCCLSASLLVVSRNFKSRGGPAVSYQTPCCGGSFLSRDWRPTPSHPTFRIKLQTFLPEKDYSFIAIKARHTFSITAVGRGCRNTILKPFFSLPWLNALSFLTFPFILSPFPPAKPGQPLAPMSVVPHTVFSVKRQLLFASVA